MAGKGDTPRPLSVTPETYAANYARIRWTESPETFCPPLRDPVQDPREAMRQRHLAETKTAINGHPVVYALVQAVGADWVPIAPPATPIHTHNLACFAYGCHVDNAVTDDRESMRQRHLEEARIAINGAPCGEDWPARDALPTTDD